MPILGLIVCIVAAVRLLGTPLAAFTLAMAGANAGCLVWALVGAVRGRTQPARIVTIVQHGTAALAVFLLIVSFSLP